MSLPRVLRIEAIHLSISAITIVRETPEGQSLVSLKSLSFRYPSFLSLSIEEARELRMLLELYQIHAQTIYVGEFWFVCDNISYVLPEAKTFEVGFDGGFVG